MERVVCFRCGKTSDGPQKYAERWTNCPQCGSDKWDIDPRKEIPSYEDDWTVLRPQSELPKNKVVTTEDGRRPLISVVIVSHGYGRYLKKAIRSVIEQTYEGWEIIVTNSDPHDTEAKLLGVEFASKVQYFEIENRGASFARNFGIRHSSGDRIVCLDADDWLDPHYLEEIVRNDSIADVLAPPFSRYYEEKEKVDHAGYVSLKSLTFQNMMEENMIPEASCFRRRVWEVSGGYGEQFGDCMEDWEYWIRLAHAGHTFAAIPSKTALYYYRIHHGQEIQSADREARVNVAMEKVRNRYLFPPKPETVAMSGIREAPRTSEYRDTLLTVYFPYRSNLSMAQSAWYLADQTAGRWVKFVILDNGSKDHVENWAQMKLSKRWRVVRWEDNAYFIRALNHIAQTCDTPFAGTMHTDWFAYEYNWAEFIINSFLTNPEIGMVGTYGFRGCESAHHNHEKQVVRFYTSEACRMGARTALLNEAIATKVDRPEFTAFYDGQTQFFRLDMLKKTTLMNGYIEPAPYEDQIAMESLWMGYKNLLLPLRAAHVGSNTRNDPDTTVNNLHGDNENLIRACRHNNAKWAYQWRSRMPMWVDPVTGVAHWNERLPKELF